MIEAEHQVRNRLEDRPDLRIRLEQFLRTQFQRALHQLAIDLKFRISAIDRGDEAVPLGGGVAVIAEEGFRLTLQQTLRRDLVDYMIDGGTVPTGLMKAIQLLTFHLKKGHVI